MEKKSVAEKSIFPKSEKWLPAFTTIWGTGLLTFFIIAAWIDPLRYTAMMEALKNNVQAIQTFGVIIFGGSFWYGKYRMDYKADLAKVNGFVATREKKEIIS